MPVAVHLIPIHRIPCSSRTCSKYPLHKPSWHWILRNHFFIVGFGFLDQLFRPGPFALFEQAKERDGDAESGGLGFERASARDAEVAQEPAELGVVDGFARAPAFITTVQ